MPGVGTIRPGARSTGSVCERSALASAARRSAPGDMSVTNPCYPARPGRPLRLGQDEAALSGDPDVQDIGFDGSDVVGIRTLHAQQRAGLAAGQRHPGGVHRAEPVIPRATVRPRKLRCTATARPERRWPRFSASPKLRTHGSSFTCAKAPVGLGEKHRAIASRKDLLLAEECGARYRGALLIIAFRVQPARSCGGLGTAGAQPAAFRDGEGGADMD